ncbi:RNA-binding S4 domain-containing protein [Tomitella cavernea]|uniref:RNA-binding S4 domain-containing protein n=1 Tax=Tomitella cavernea TaxID=1387982 RepID=UPI0019048CE0|nr:RNA-binding S4 domain-containing protein [Tomitella cavernea]
MRDDGAVSESDAPAVPIRDAAIRLGQFLKLANLLDSGAEAKQVIAEGEVAVNGETETRRGRQLRDGDVVSVFGTEARVEGP